MSDARVDVRWLEGLRFEAVGGSGTPLLLDGDGVTATTPVEALLVALAGCMSADVVDILTKMRVPITGLAVRTEADRRPEPPRRYTAIRLTYRAEGVPTTDRDKLERAVALSRETYCSVLHSLDPSVELSIAIEAA